MMLELLKLTERLAMTEELLDMLLNKVNLVTCEFRHGGRCKDVSIKSMTALCDRQLEVEEQFKKIKEG